MTAQVGMALPPQRIGPVSLEAMKQVALFLDDPNPIHFDAEAVRRMGLGDKPINQGPNGMGYVMNMLIAFCGAPDAVRRFRCRLHANVFAGDMLMAGGEITAIRGDEAECDVWLRRGDDVVISGTASIKLPARAHAS